MRASRGRQAAAVAAVTVVLAIFPGGIGAAANTVQLGNVRTADSERIDAFVAERMAAHGIPGAAVAVVRGGEIVHLAGYGTADPKGRPITPDTPFLIGSVSKPFTAAAVLQLVDEGVLSLDEPVLPYLDALTDQVPAGFENVTVEQLLNHTGGMSASVGLAGTMRIYRGAHALDRRVPDLLTQPLATEPSTRFEYSNADGMLLAAVVEQATGRDFADHLRQRVFDPLGMSGSFASDRDPQAAELATGHWLWFGRWRPANLPYDPAGAGMGYIGSTARDLTKFMQALVADEPSRVLPATATEIARGPVVPTGWHVPLESGHGLGWFVDELAGEPVVSHAGSLADFTTHVILAPEADGLSIAVLTNASAYISSGHAGQYDLSVNLARLLLNTDPQPTDPSVLLRYVAPIASWGAALLIVFAACRYVFVARRRSRRAPRGHAPVTRRWFLREMLPAIGYLALGMVTLATLPLAAARDFYPDVGWGVTITAYVAVGWGLIRTVLATAALTKAGARGGPREPQDVTSAAVNRRAGSAVET